MKEAYDALRQATRIERKDENNYVDLAAICLDYANYDLGLEITEIGLRNVPNSDRLYLQRGVMRAMKGQLKEAEQDLAAASKLAPQPRIASMTSCRAAVAAAGVPGTERVSWGAAMSGLLDWVRPLQATSSSRTVVSPGAGAASLMQGLHHHEVRLTYARLSRQDRRRQKGPWQMAEAHREARRIGEVIRQARVLQRRSRSRPPPPRRTTTSSGPSCPDRARPPRAGR